MPGSPPRRSGLAVYHSHQRERRRKSNRSPGYFPGRPITLPSTSASISSERGPCSRTTFIRATANCGAWRRAAHPSHTVPAAMRRWGAGSFPCSGTSRPTFDSRLGTDVGGGTGFGMLKEGLQAYLMQRVAPQPITLSPAQMLYLATRAGAEALGIEDQTGDFETGKAADFVYLRPPEGSVLAGVLKRIEDPGAYHCRAVHARGCGKRQGSSCSGSCHCRSKQINQSRAKRIHRLRWVGLRTFALGRRAHLASPAIRVVSPSLRTDEWRSGRGFAWKNSWRCCGLIRISGHARKISPSSASEQAGAGLDRLTSGEYARLIDLNRAYREKFGFPFLYAVKGADKFAILEALERRLSQNREDEFREALRQVYRIARFRLESIVSP